MRENSSDLPPLVSFEYAILRVMPRVERGEFVNVGALLLCTAQNFLEARIELNRERLEQVFPDVEMSVIEAHLESVKLVCVGGKEAGPIGQLSQRERFRWLAAPRSTMLQTSPIHCGMCGNPEAMLEQIMNSSVR